MKPLFFGTAHDHQEDHRTWGSMIKLLLMILVAAPIYQAYAQDIEPTKFPQSLEDHLNAYVDCNMHWANKFSGSQEDAPVIAMATASKCLGEKQRLHGELEAYYQSIKPEKGAEFEEVAHKGASTAVDKIENQTKRAVIAAIVEKRMTKNDTNKR